MAHGFSGVSGRHLRTYRDHVSAILQYSVISVRYLQKYVRGRSVVDTKSVHAETAVMEF